MISAFLKAICLTFWLLLIKRKALKGDDIILLQANDTVSDLWRENEENLRMICQVKMQNFENETDDIISETFLAFCEYTEKNGLPKNPKAWLYSVLNNRINDKFRKIYRHKKNVVNLDNMYQIPYEVDFDEEILKDISIEKLKEKLLSQLSKEELELYEYIYVKRLSYRRLSKKYGVSYTAIKQRHYRLCNKIKKLAKTIEYNYEVIK